MSFREDRIGDCRLILGDCREVLQALPAESVHCCVTSPPYFGLRDYGGEPEVWGGDPKCRHSWNKETVPPRHTDDGIAGSTLQGGNSTQAQAQRQPTTRAFCRLCNAWRGSLGLEPTPSLYVEHMVEIMRGVRRVLRQDGTLWLNIGDSYAADYHGNKNSLIPTSATNGRTNGTNENLRASTANRNGLKSKDLIGIPWMLAFALRDDGWYLRRDIIWHKPNPMPESVTDRCTSAHEYLFQLTKSARYYYDAEAIKEPAVRRVGSIATFGNKDAKARLVRQLTGNMAPGIQYRTPTATRNKRSVWTIATAPFRGAHFATFPPALVEPCILAGTSERGACQKCGAQWERAVNRRSIPGRPNSNSIRGHSDSANRSISGAQRGTMYVASETIGWHPTCACEAGAVPATVIDPFAGASTTALVASNLGRASISIELSAAYHDIACRRIATAQPPLRAA